MLEHAPEEEKPEMEVAGLTMSLLKFQKEALYWLKNREDDLEQSGGILADENDSESLAMALKRFASVSDVLAMVAKAQRRLRAEFDATTQSAKLQAMLASHYAPTKPPNLFE